VENFTSTKFTRLLIRGGLPSYLKVGSINKHIIQEWSDKIVNFCEHANDGGKGFNVTGWFRRGIVSDEGAVQGNTGQRNSNENMIDASIISFHLTDIDVNNDLGGLPLNLD